MAKQASKKMQENGGEKKESMRSFILVKYEQLILCDCELPTRLEVYVAHKIRWQWFYQLENPTSKEPNMQQLLNCIPETNLLFPKKKD